MASTKNTKKNNRGHSQKWHGSMVTLRAGMTSVTNCPCEGKAQKSSARLTARRNEFDNNLSKISNPTSGLLYHRPGSQNRKK